MTFSGGENGASRQIARWLAMADVRAAKNLRATVAARVRANLCLCCDRQAKRRGLCDSCNRLFRVALAERPATERPAWEEQQIRRGKILAVGHAAKIRRPNPFGDPSWYQVPAGEQEGGAA